MTEGHKIGYVTSAMLLLGLVLGAGLWVTPVVATSMVGSSILVLAPLTIIPILLLYPVYITLSKGWSVSGAHYYYVSRLLIPESKVASQFVASIYIFALISINVLVSFQLLAVAPAQYLHSLAPGVPLDAFLVVLILLPLAMLRFGIRIVGWSELVLTTALLLSLGLVLATGIFEFDPSNITAVGNVRISAAGAAFILLFGTVTPALYVIDLGSDIKNATESVSSLFLITSVANILVASVLVAVIMGVAGGTDLTGKTLHHIAGQIDPGLLVSTTGIGAFLAGLTTSLGVATIVTRWTRAVTKDGLFPDVLAEENEHGEPGYLLLVIAIVAVGMLFADVTLTDLASTSVMAAMFIPVPIAAIGFRLPSTHPEFFEHEAIADSRVLRPAVVRWSSLLAGLIMISMSIALFIENPLSGAIYVGILFVGTILYGAQLMYKGEALYQGANYEEIRAQADD